MAFEIIQINRVPKTVKDHDWASSRHPQEEVVGYCIKKHLHQAQIDQSAVHLYTDETLMTRGPVMFIHVVASTDDGLFYFSSPAAGAEYKMLGRQL